MCECACADAHVYEILVPLHGSRWKPDVLSSLKQKRLRGFNVIIILLARYHYFKRTADFVTSIRNPLSRRASRPLKLYGFVIFPLPS